MIVATADDARHEQRLRAEGADLVIRPHDLVGDWLATAVARSLAADNDDHRERHEPSRESAFSHA
jgi:Trk K+ transport system NAD-binding subunit